MILLDTNVISETVNRIFQGRIKYLDDPATQVFADQAATAQRNGRRAGFADGAIAAIAIASGFSIASRDISEIPDFSILASGCQPR